MNTVKGAVIDRFTGRWKALSNFEPAWVYFDGVAYPTVEHAFQAAKTFNQWERDAIRSARTPAEAKRLGRAVDLRADWEVAKVDVMRELLVWKFTAEPFRSILLATGDAELVEGNFWRDTVWGMCNGVGENRLGRLLMDVRNGLVLTSAATTKGGDASCALR